MIVFACQVLTDVECCERASRMIQFGVIQLGGIQLPMAMIQFGMMQFAVIQ